MGSHQRHHLHHFLIGSALARWRASWWLPTIRSHINTWLRPGLKAFTAAVLGGIGNLGGAMAAAAPRTHRKPGRGLHRDITGGFPRQQLPDVFAFFVLIVVLVFRPSGLLASAVAERA